MLRQLQMRFESSHTSVHTPTPCPTTQPSAPTCKLMRLARRRSPTGTRFVAAAAPTAASAFVQVEVQGLEAVELLPIDLDDR